MFLLKLSLLLSLSLANAAKISPKLSNGNDAQIAEFPFLVSIQQINVHIGHGSLLNEKWILSSARLLYPQTIDQLNIEYGNSVITPGRTEENNAEIRQIIFHEDFDFGSPRVNDISLIETVEPIVIDLHQPFAKLIIPGGSRFLSGTESTIAGWGHILPDFVRTNQLQKADLRILSTEECNEAVGDTEKPHERNICAIGESVICFTDIGNFVGHSMSVQAFKESFPI
jgi:hypothetical protein